MFECNTSIKLENIKDIKDVENNLINPIDALPDGKYELNTEEKDRIIHGMGIKNRLIQNKNNAGDIVFFVYGGKMYGVGYIDKDTIKVKKVFEEL